MIKNQIWLARKCGLLILLTSTISMLASPSRVAAQFELEKLLTMEQDQVVAMATTKDYFEPILFEVYFDVKRQEYIVKLKAAQVRIENIERLHADADAKLQSYYFKKSQHAEQALEAGVTVESISEALAELNGLARETAIELAGKQGREQRAQLQLEEISKELAEQASDDPISEKLKDLLRQSEIEVARARLAFENGAFELKEVAQIEAAMVQTEIRLLERQQVLGQAKSDERLAQVRAELVQVGLDISELRSRLESIEVSRSRIARLYKEQLQMTEQGDFIEFWSGEKNRLEGRLQELREAMMESRYLSGQLRDAKSRFDEAAKQRAQPDSVED